MSERVPAWIRSETAMTLFNYGRNRGEAEFDHPDVETQGGIWSLTPEEKAVFFPGVAQRYVELRGHKYEKNDPKSVTRASEGELPVIVTHYDLMPRHSD